MDKFLLGFLLNAFLATHHLGMTGELEDLADFIDPNDIDILFSDTKDDPTTLGPLANGSKKQDPSVSKRFNTTTPDINDSSDCFGLGSMISKLRWFLNLRPGDSEDLDVEFYVQNRQMSRVQVLPTDTLDLHWTNFDPNKPIIIIVHGFMSYSNAPWVRNMTKAFLDRDDVNVITVDWSRGGRTWKYWRAAVNTRTVGNDLARFLKQIMKDTGARASSFHFVGHSLGAHICSFAANVIGGVRRITGLDPAQPCFKTSDLNMLLDKSDAEFVDVIHTNGRQLSKFGLGMPNACGHQDFYPNGGRKQPGCHSGKWSFINSFVPVSKGKLKKAICNHKRSYELFTETLKNNSCKLIGHQWNLSYSNINSSLSNQCTDMTCPEMGIEADKFPARGTFYVITTDKKPFCDIYPIQVESRQFLLNDLKKKDSKPTTPPTATTTLKTEGTTLKKSRWFSFLG